jgi:hypothetical protein
MAQIIVELGSGNTCRNDKTIIRKMIDAVADCDSGKHDITLKWQLWEADNKTVGKNVRLTEESFIYAQTYAADRGYLTTASVLDYWSLRFMLNYYDAVPFPFIKIACRPEVYPLIASIPRGIPVYVSMDDFTLLDDQNCVKLCCIRKYPATVSDYERTFCHDQLTRAISDHTVGLDLWRKYKPAVYERHFRLPDSTGPDAGPFAVTPNELWEIL